jgi:hypothetical protein
VSDRYDLFHLRFYVDNVLHEWRRYGQIGRGLLALQPASWLIVACGLAGVWTLWRGPDRDRVGSRLLLTALVVGAGLLAVFVKPKLYHYNAALWPVLALTAATGLLAVLRSPQRALRLVAVVLLIVVLADGLRGWNRVTLAALSMTPYTELCDKLAAHIPSDSRVLALPHYWFGLTSRVREYRSFFGPMLFASPRFAGNHPPLGEMLAAAGATVIVLDRPMLTFLREAFDPSLPAHEYVVPAAGLRDYLAARSARRVVIDDPSYGRFEIHYVQPVSAPAVPAP